MEVIIDHLKELGARFVIRPEEIRDRLSRVRVFLFDWDGVFNNGQKFGASGSPFSETDSMGINLLKLGYFLQTGVLPFTGIITGASNPAAKYFVEREHMNVCIRGFTDKKHALKMLRERFDLEPGTVAFVFDDVLDLPIAEQALLRFCIRRPSLPAFQQYLVAQDLCDYFTAHAENGVREVCELLLTLSGQYADVLEVRRAYGVQYQKYLEARNVITPVILQPDPKA